MPFNSLFEMPVFDRHVPRLAVKAFNSLFEMRASQDGVKTRLEGSLSILYLRCGVILQADLTWAILLAFQFSI